MGNICSTRDENDMREQQKNNNSQPSPGGGRNNNKNVFKAGPKGKQQYILIHDA
jgi:hypothetical protein